MDVTIHRLCDRPEYAAQCDSWDLAEWPRIPETEAFFASHYAEAAGNRRAQIPQVFVALCNDRPIGMTSLIADDHPDFMDLGPWLASVYVIPEYRGQGIFMKLHSAVIEYTRNKMDVKKLYVYSHLDFSKWGWCVVGQTYDPFAPHKNVTIFRYDF